MKQQSDDAPRVATVAEAATVATLLDAFNREYRTPTPGPSVLVTRLRRLLAGKDVVALLAGDPAFAVALLTLRPNVWYEAPVALLDEFFYERHGYTNTEPGQDQPCLYYYRELPHAPS